MNPVVETVEERVGKTAGEDVYVLPASSAQERLSFLERLDPGGSVYNEPSAHRITGHLDRDALEASLNEILRRHESLRTSFATEEGVLVQHVHSTWAFKLPVVDVSAAADPEAVFQRLLSEEEYLPRR